MITNGALSRKDAIFAFAKVDQNDPIAVRTFIHGEKTESAWETCNECNYNKHECPGCGEWLYHGTGVCGPCKTDIKMDEQEEKNKNE